jgi:hypothetical protein
VSFRLAADLARNPELMIPPPVIVPPIGVAGRVVLLTLGPKGGKSTTAAGLITEASRLGVKSGLLTLDEAEADSLQRLERLGANLEFVYTDADFTPATLREEIAAHGIELLALDHVGKLAERSPDFGPGSQGDPVLWGRLIAPFTTLARELNLAVVLLDQSRRSDNRYAGSAAKAGSVDLLCELQPKGGGLVCTPRGRIPLPPFRVDLDEDGRPVFSDSLSESPNLAPRLNLVTEREKAAVLEALQSAEPEGLTAKAWESLATDATGLSRRTFFNIRRTLHHDGQISYASKLYRVSPKGARWLEKLPENSNGRACHAA